MCSSDLSSLLEQRTRRRSTASRCRSPSPGSHVCTSPTSPRSSTKPPSRLSSPRCALGVQNVFGSSNPATHAVRSHLRHALAQQAVQEHSSLLLRSVHRRRSSRSRSLAWGAKADSSFLQADAQAALALHNTELEPGLKLTVYVSDPGRKKGRTDAGANQRELFVGGLSKFVSELDLKRLFEPVSVLALLDEAQC